MASTAVRSFDLTAYIPGQPLAVTIEVTPDPATTSYMIEDTPPPGWTISAISNSGVFDTLAGKVKWIPFDGNSTVTLTYTATPLVSGSGEQSFGGLGNYGQENIPIVNADGEADHTIPEFRFHPADEHDEILVVGPDLKIQIDEAVRYWAVFFESILNPSGPFTPWPRQPEDVWNNQTYAQSAINLYKTQDGAYIFDPDVAEPFAWMTPGLSVKPSENAIVAADIVFGITGPEGGPFTPETKVYTITNTSGDPLDFSISVDADWIDLFIDVEGTTEPPLPVTTSPAGLTGTLDPDEVRLVTAVTNDGIELLSVGTHIGTVSFTNLTTGEGGGDRQISATIAISLVSPFTGFDPSGIENEPATFSPSEITYTLVNPTAEELDFTVSKSVNWLSFEVVFPGSTNPPVDTENNSVGGTLAPNGDAGDTAEVTILLDAEASLLEASGTGSVTHTAEISFTNNTDHSNDTARTVNLTLSAREMRVTPLTDYDIVGSESQEGRAFTPDSKPYLVENTTGSPIGFTVAKTVPWIDTDTVIGVISPGGSVTVTVSTNDGVDALAPGDFGDTLIFTNTSSGDGNTTRDVSISVPESIVQPTTGFSSSGKEQGPFSPTVKFYDLINPDGIDSMDYEIRWVADWFIVEDTGDGTGPPPDVEEEKFIRGTLGPAETRNFGVNLTPAADELTTLTYSDVLRFTNLTNNDGNTARLITLAVAVPDLLVSPRAGFESVGGIGGPFTPSEQVYTLTNTSGSDLDYDVTAPADTWVEVSGDDIGTLAPNGTGMGTIGPGAATTVTVSMDNAGATALPAGVTTSAVVFENTTTVEALNERTVMLTVASMIVEPLTGLQTVGAPGGQLGTTTKEYVVTNTDSSPLDFKVSPSGGRNFGVETVHATQAAADNIGWSTKVTLDRDAIVQSITAHVGGGIGSARYAIHRASDFGDKPGELLAETALFTTAVSFDLVTADLQFPTPIEAGTYWLTIGFDTAAQRFVWSDLGVGMSSRGNDDAIAFGFIAFWTEDATSTREISIFASYTEAPFLEIFEFGQSGVAGALQQGGVEDKQFASSFVLDRPGILRGIRANTQGVGNFRYAIYTDNAGEPDQLLAETKTFFTANVRLFRFRSFGRQTPLSKAFIPLEAGTYWLALAMDTNIPKYSYDDAVGVLKVRFNDAVANGFLSSWGASDNTVARTLAIAGEVATGAWPGIRIITPTTPPATTAPAGTTGPPESPLGFTDLIVEETLGAGESVTVEVELIGDTFPARIEPYNDAVRFQNTTDGSGDTDRDLDIRSVTMTVSPEGAYDATAQAGGAVTPASKVYTIANNGNSDLDYLVTSNVNWVTLDDGTSSGQSIDGTISQGGTVDVTVTISIAGLEFGDHIASISFTNMTINDGTGNTSRPVTLDLTADMEVTAGSTSITGFEGGPFSIVDDSTYTITNTSAQPLDYRVRHAADWFEIDDGNAETPFTTAPASTEPPVDGFFVEGTLAAFPGPGNTVDITVSDDAETAALPLGSLLFDLLLFENLTTGVGNAVRSVSASITPSLVIEPQETLQSTGPFGGPFAPQSKEYTVTNVRAVPVEFTVTKTESWVALDQFVPTTVPPTSFPPFTTAPDGSISGILEPGESRIIVVSIDSDADALPVNTHIDFVEFSASADTGVAEARAVILEVISV